MTNIIWHVDMCPELKLIFADLSQYRTVSSIRKAIDQGCGANMAATTLIVFSFDNKKAFLIHVQIKLTYKADFFLKIASIMSKSLCFGL